MQRLSTVEQKSDSILGLLRSLMHKISTNFSKDADSNKDIYAALAKAQGDIKIAYENSENPYFKSKYADLAAIVKASRQPLSQNGLAVFHFLSLNEYGQQMLTTRLAHASGQYIDSIMPVNPKKDDVQSFASQLTYIKRYAYASIVGVTTSEEDDDGEVAVAETRDLYAKGTALNTRYNPREQSSEKITLEQLEEIERELIDNNELAQNILEGFKLQSFADLPKNKFKASIDRIREIKAVRAGIKNR